MARIIRTNPKSQKRVSLRVVFSFLLFMQIQLPNAREIRNEKVRELSFHLTAEKTQQVSLKQKEADFPATTLAYKVN